MQSTFSHSNGMQIKNSLAKCARYKNPKKRRTMFCFLKQQKATIFIRNQMMRKYGRRNGAEKFSFATELRIPRAYVFY